jgi:hypothetical protein
MHWRLEGLGSLGSFCQVAVEGRLGAAGAQPVDGGFCDVQSGLTNDGIVCCLSGLS